MILLNKEQFAEIKTTDTIVIYGCGWSINKITEYQWKYLLSCDSIGMNWFLNGNIIPKYYLIREQCTTPKKILADQTLGMFINKINNNLSSIRVVLSMSHSKTDYQHADNTDRFTGKGIIFNDILENLNDESFKDDIYIKGVHHGKCTLTNCVHFAISMGYKKILFAGVDLYDCRYFWLPYGITNLQTMKEGGSANSIHNTCSSAISMVSIAKKYIQMMVVNPKSKLCEIIEGWRYEEVRKMSASRN